MQDKSDLPSEIDDSEVLARFIPEKNKRFTPPNVVKAKSFMPNTKPPDRNASAYRAADDMVDWLINAHQFLFNGSQPLKAIAFVDVGDVRKAGAIVTANEPPERHALIEGWPWIDDDLEEQKSKQLEMAGVIASKSRLHVLPEG